MLSSTRSVSDTLRRTTARTRARANAVIKTSLVYATGGALAGFTTAAVVISCIGGRASDAAYNAALNQAIADHKCNYQQINNAGDTTLICPGGYQEVQTVYQIAHTAADDAQAQAVENAGGAAFILEVGAAVGGAVGFFVGAIRGWRKQLPMDLDQPLLEGVSSGRVPSPVEQKDVPAPARPRTP